MDSPKLHGMAEAILSAIDDKNYTAVRDLAKDLRDVLHPDMYDVRDRIRPKSLLEDMANIEFMLDDSQFEAAKMEMKLVNLYTQIGIAHSLKRIAETLGNMGE